MNGLELVPGEVFGGPEQCEIGAAMSAILGYPEQEHDNSILRAIMGSWGGGLGLIFALLVARSPLFL